MHAALPHARTALAPDPAAAPPRRGEARESTHPLRDESFDHERFVARARALFVARAGFLLLAAALLFAPRVAAALGLEPRRSVPILTGLALAAVASRLLLPHRRLGPAVAWLSLLLDCAAVSLALTGSGGLYSPLLGTQPILVAAFALLFRPPWAAMPGFLLLPLAVDPGSIGAGPAGLAELFLFGWYATLSAALLAALSWLRRREDGLHAERLALQAALRRRAVEEERTRLSREIHDGVGASLASLVLQAEFVLGQAGAPAPASGLHRDLAELKGTAEEAVDELRRSLRLLRDDFDPIEAAEERCRAFSQRHRIPVAFRSEGTPGPLAPAAQLALFRILQESLSNVARHANARRIEVALEFTLSARRLKVRDDGEGFDPARRKPGHYGLRGMRERAAALGGTLEILSAPGRGTEVLLTLPAGSPT